MRFPVFVCAMTGPTQPSSHARSMISTSICLIVPARPYFMNPVVSPITSSSCRGHDCFLGIDSTLERVAFSFENPLVVLREDLGEAADVAPPPRQHALRDLRSRRLEVLGDDPPQPV